jgi:hypothetical protein
MVKNNHQERMMENQSNTKTRTKTKLVIDMMIFIAFLITMDPRTSGIAVHEWLATAAFAVLVVHLLLNWDWIVSVTRCFFGKTNTQSRINYIINWLLFIAGTVIMLSGFMISESLLPSLGFSLPRNFAWRSWHDLSANLFLILLGLHTALHWSWIVDAFKRYIFKPIGRIFSTRSRKDIPA